MSAADYSPLIAEKRCAVCGLYRGQHIGASTDDGEMRCPTSFVPLAGSSRYEQYATAT